MASKGQKFLPISDAMARDIDSGKAAGRDFADFLPDHVAQEIYDASRPGPVRAENLVPISKAEARRRTTFDGETMPKFPATRRVIPAPYQRDRVIGGSHGKAWQELTARQIHPGDIIPDLGLVTLVEERTVYAAKAHVDQGTAWSNTLIGGPNDEHPAGYDPDSLVAIGTAVRVTGKGGKVVVMRPETQGRVFR